MTNISKTYKVIGLMSGTSLDGLDIAYCHIKKDQNSWSFSILKTESVDYDTNFREELKNTVNLNPVALLAFHNRYGTWLGTQVKRFMDQHKVDVDFISSHGHTVFHQPEIGLTYQIGSGQHIANTCNQKVICDFRTNDVALGGQGAPLVPIGDELLFKSYDFCLNLGGISNISFDQNGKRIAYDIAPANMLLNYIISKINLAYDDRGQLSETGTLNQKLLTSLNQLDYYQESYPKSLGYEWFAEKIIPIIENTKDSIENLLHTSVYHIAEQISNVIKQTEKQKSSLLITGGGAKNDFLIAVLRQKLHKFSTVVIPDENIIDYKEALIFAFMGVLKERNEINCLQSVTGAKKDSSSGIVFHPS
ncbi:anhydro-N-acetylmuramic acid kinase [Aquimarina sp. 2201CG14-23]|uniref:anhydro-N-acetylmuramic acid kinase n=1 Tax=Aquimarina mycalae TaxID=3040073 RepID=UPI002477F612|nr:anhydro-N-acetylmuramic acid kinase [Aquimarina sp. 2201CG14-23]MDH7444237.1 anhydro-N-acetylmuramic acid kinase [Aquimarina sp. 2201CG14-23]